MYENYDEETIADEMMSMVDDKYDKREGSVIRTALAPMAYLASEIYAAIDMLYSELFADSASYYYLAKRAAEHGVFPKNETKAVLKMTVVPATSKITIGDVFQSEDGSLSYKVISEIDRLSGTYKVECDVAGNIGNSYIGDVLPVETGDPLNDMQTATLSEVIVAGDAEEDVEELRTRYFESFDVSKFGGNKAQYEEWVKGIAGVESCKILRQWENEYSPASLMPTENVNNWFNSIDRKSISEDAYRWLSNVYNASKSGLLTVGGTIKIVISATGNEVPSEQLVKDVQTTIDPNPGEGSGIAPIGHVVIVTGVKKKIINYTLGLKYASGFTFSSLQTSISDAINEYHKELRQSWSKEESVIVRVAQITVKILKIEGIIDVNTVMINGKTENLELAYDEIPEMGIVNEKVS